MPYYPVPSRLRLPYRFNNITIDFAAMDPSRPELVGNQYKLEGYDILNDTNASIKIVDKYENNVATGTKVILSFNLN